jgi:glycosyltransferase involved in cell wall biosynthesis
MALTALVLVRNPVTHDNRVLREVTTLRDDGFDVVVAGVVSTLEPARRARVAGVPVVRLDPRARPRLRRRRPAVPPAAAADATGSAAATGPPPTGSAPTGSAPTGSAPTGSAREESASTGSRLAGVSARLRRLAVTVAYHLQGVALARRVGPALVHANDYNTMWIALGAKWLCGSAVVYDSHELWADRNGRREWRPWLLACETLFVRLADVTITASPGYATALAGRYRIAEPVVVRNIPDAPAVNGPPPGAAGPSTRSPGRASQPPHAVYVGGLMPGRGLEVSIRALAAVPELRLRLIGPGSPRYCATLRELAERCGVAARLELREPVAPDEVVAAAARASVGLMLIEPVCRSYELTLPNKLFEYALAGVPILASDLAVIGPLVRDHGLGAAVDVGDVRAVAAGTRALLEPERNAAVRLRVRQFAASRPWSAERRVLSRVYADALAARQARPSAPFRARAGNGRAPRE